jgi:alkanesulfonate monooxygenase SsuD/methylene tetrahydromethanopterin reductase-like flavin-dependent oxidoreductase (luciferase family)
MIKVGLLLPVGLDPFYNEQKEVIYKITKTSLESLWVRDLPISLKKDKDIGTWYDPFVYLGYLSKIFEDNENCKLGIAAINTSIRNPIITSKAIVSLQHLSNNQLFIGLGSGEKKEILKTFDVKDKEQSLIEFMNFLNECLWIQKPDFKEEVTLSLPNIYTPPLIHLASSSDMVWKNISVPIDGWLTWFLSPKIFKRKYANISNHIKVKEVTMSINLIISEKQIFKMINFKGINSIYLGKKELYEFF